MVRRLPFVADQCLHVSQELSDPILVDSEAWYSWLAAEQHQSFAFICQLGSFTVRRERRRQQWYWYLYHKQEGKLRKAYLGKTEEMSLERLNAVTAKMVVQGDLHADAHARVLAPGRAAEGSNDPLATALHLNASFPGSGHVPAHPLPGHLTPLIGREQEVAAVCTLLRRKEIRLVTLTGTAGVGKTRLALEVAGRMVHDFADGIYLVSLASLSDPAFVIATIARSIGVTRRGSQPILDRLKTSLREKQRLLLLDNFEHVITEAPLLIELLEACPGLKLLVTSREVLRLRAEHQCFVPPLTLPDDSDLADNLSLTHVPAVHLFLQRAQAIQSDFHLTTGNATSIAQICIRLDGLPLAIELAAARIKVLAPQALLERLDRRLHVLTGGARDLPLRQQTLRNTISWSYELLPAGEQQLFRRLSVFVGGCSLEAIEAVCAAFDDEVDHVLEAVASLIDKSLVQQTEQESTESRLVMLETIREYGLERLEASGEAEVMRRQHATYFLQVALESLPKMNSAEQATWFKRLEADHDNMRAVLRFTLESQEVQMGLRLAGVLASGFWISCNYESEGRSWIAQVLEQPGAEARTLARAQALRGLGLLIHVQGDCPDAQRVLEESVSIGREIGAAAKLDLAGALHTLAYVALLQGNPAYARELAEESLRLFQELGVAWGVGLALHHLGRAMLELGDPGSARSFLEESSQQFRVAGDSNLLRLAMNALGLVALHQEDYTDCLHHLRGSPGTPSRTGGDGVQEIHRRRAGPPGNRCSAQERVSQISLILPAEPRAQPGTGLSGGSHRGPGRVGGDGKSARTAGAGGTVAWGRRGLARGNWHQAFAPTSGGV